MIFLKIGDGSLNIPVYYAEIITKPTYYTTKYSYTEKLKSKKYKKLGIGLYEKDDIDHYLENVTVTNFGDLQVIEGDLYSLLD